MKKKWVGRVFLGRDENGRQQYHWCGRFATRRERDEAVAAARVAIKADGCDCRGCQAIGRKATVSASMPTIGEQVELFITEYAKQNKTSSVASIETRLCRFRKDFCDRKLNDLSRAELKDWIAGRGDWVGEKPASASHPPAIVSFFNWSIVEDEQPLQANPARGLSARGKGRAEQPPPTEEEFKRLVEACSVLGDYGPMMRAVFLFGAFQLMRPSELFELKESDIDFKRSRISKSRRLYRGTVDEPKTGRKLIALTPPARAAIAPILPGDGEYVFRNRSDGQLRQAMLALYWGKVLARADLEFDFYHATKHYGVWYFWTQLRLSDRAIAAQAGWSLKTVDKMLATYGHGEIGALEEVDKAFEGREIPGLRVIEGGKR